MTIKCGVRGGMESEFRCERSAGHAGAHIDGDTSWMTTVIEVKRPEPQSESLTDRERVFIINALEARALWPDSNAEVAASALAKIKAGRSVKTCHHCGAIIWRTSEGRWADNAPIDPLFCPHAIDFTHEPAEEPAK